MDKVPARYELSCSSRSGRKPQIQNSMGLDEVQRTWVEKIVFAQPVKYANYSIAAQEKVNVPLA